MINHSATISLACELIRRQSVTPDDAGCQQLMIERLKNVGFQITPLRYGDVDNFWAVHGNSGKTLAFAGHTDVVPAGEIAAWQYPPFEPTIKDGQLCGRGAADMKSSLAAMCIAAEQFVEAHPNHPNRLAFLITSDEEGIAIDGTVKVIQHLEQQQEKIDWCIVGEPSSSEITGDVIKNGRRGSLGLTLKIQGVQGHVAYPQLAKNPIHLSTAAVAELCALEWDHGNDYFPATSFQISNIHGGTGATNVIPGELTIIANFRFSTEVTVEQLQQRTESILNAHDLDYEIDWTLNGMPFLTKPAELVEAVVAAIAESTGINTQLSTAGGTSDGRFIAPTGAQVVEIGTVNATIHQVNERVNIEEVDSLTAIYRGIMERLLR